MDKKAEAIKRMKKLDIIEDAIKQFEESGTVMMSEGGILFELDDEQKRLVSEFELEHNALVYMVIHNLASFGELYSLLYVSNYPEEWEMDNEDLDYGLAMSYVMNLTDELCSEFGSIGIANRFGGIIRTD